MATKTKKDKTKVDTGKWNASSWELYVHLVESGMGGKAAVTVQQDYDVNAEYRAKHSS